jgi:hypothetical protein
MDTLGPALRLPNHSYQCNHTTSQPTALDTPETPLLPLWLTYVEVDAIIQLCGSSTAHVGSAEDTLFPKLGDLYRAFRR